MWFTMLSATIPQKLPAKSGPLGLLALTNTWWANVPSRGNMYWHEASTCGNVGLKNPKFASHQAFRESLLRILNESARVKRECPAPAGKCPTWYNYNCGNESGVKEQALFCLDPVLQATCPHESLFLFVRFCEVMPAQRAWEEHMEFRAVVGPLTKGPSRVSQAWR